MSEEPPCPPNKLGITDKAELDRVEANLAGLAAAAMVTGELPIPAVHGIERFKAIHRNLFGELFEHGGNFRRNPSIKAGFVDHTGGTTAFAAPGRIHEQLSGIFRDVRADDGFKGLGRLDFVEKSTQLLNRLNLVHAFTEGNGRAQTLYVTLAAQEAGYELPFECVTRERMIAAAIEASRGRMEMLRDLVDEQLDPVRLRALKQAHRYFQDAEYPINDRFLGTTIPGERYFGTLVTATDKNFIFFNRGSIYIGNTQDVQLPSSGEKLGEFTAGRTPEQQAHHFVDLAEQRGTRGQCAAAIEGALAGIGDAASRDETRRLAGNRLTQARQRDAIYASRTRVRGLER